MWLRARRRVGGLLKGVLQEVMGHKNFTISELGDRPGHLLITSPGSFASANRAHCFRLTLKTPSRSGYPSGAVFSSTEPLAHNRVFLCHRCHAFAR
jgi:hypothetical protein